jgi:hypothetical protein
LGEDQMRCRAFVGRLRPFLVQSSLEKKMARCSSRLAAFDKRKFEHLTGRQAYVSHLAALARARASRTTAVLGVRKLIFKSHSRPWKLMSQARRDEYEARACRMQDDRRDALAVERATVELEFEKLKAKTVLTAGTLPPLLLRSCRFDASASHRFCEYVTSSRFSDANVSALRTLAMIPVAGPDLASQTALQLFAVVTTSPVRPNMRFSWLSFICNNRELCKTCCFKLVTPDGDIILKFLFALQAPYIVGFFRMIRIGAADLYRFDGADQFAGTWHHVFNYDWEHLIFSDDGLIDETWPVHVLLDCVSVSKGFLVSDSDWVALSELQLWISRGVVDAEEPLPEDKAEEPPELSDKADIFVVCPWLLDWKHWNHLEPQCHTVPSAPCSYGENASLHVDEAVLDFGELCDDAVAELERARELAPGPEALAITDVRLFPRTGEWTLLHHGVACDSWRAEASHDLIRAWCDNVGIRKTFTCSRALYGPTHSYELCLMWADRVQYFFRERVSEAHPRPADLARSTAAYIEPPCVASIFATGSPATTRRAEQIRRIAPL